MTTPQTPTTMIRANDNADEFDRMGAYVSSSDLGRSTAFYGAIFAREPVIRLDDFVAYAIAGGLFAIVSRERYSAGSIPGSGSVPYIGAEDLEMIRRRAATVLAGPVPVIITEPGIRLLKLFDPDRQLVEFYSLTLGS